MRCSELVDSGEPRSDSARARRSSSGRPPHKPSIGRNLHKPGGFVGAGCLAHWSANERSSPEPAQPAANGDL